MNIITGTTGTPHVTSQQQREINMALFGSGNVVLNIGKQLAASVSGNTVTIYDGCLSMQGCCASIEAGAVDEIVIENGSQGTSRIDLICAIYSNSSGIENVEFGVIKGEAAVSPVAPDVPNGKIREGASSAYMPLYEVKIENTSVISVTRMFSVYGEAKLLWSGAYYMNATTPVHLSEAISAQKEGIELVFAPYDADNKKLLVGGRNVYRISKKTVADLNGESVIFSMTGTSNFYSERMSCKALRFTDTTIEGSSYNELKGTGSSGISFNNAGFVLIAVYGV